MCKGFWKDLDRHVTPELGVVRLIDLAHSACADLGGGLVGAEFCTSLKEALERVG